MGAQSAPAQPPAPTWNLPAARAPATLPFAPARHRPRRACLEPPKLAPAISRLVWRGREGRRPRCPPRPHAVGRLRLPCHPPARRWPPEPARCRPLAPATPFAPARLQPRRACLEPPKLAPAISRLVWRGREGRRPRRRLRPHADGRPCLPCRLPARRRPLVPSTPFAPARLQPPATLLAASRLPGTARAPAIGVAWSAAGKGGASAMPPSAPARRRPPAPAMPFACTPPAARACHAVRARTPPAASYAPGLRQGREWCRSSPSGQARKKTSEGD
jgi:hypothetical protein